ncbi:hypothetical protein Zmor_027231 [Zophobas morio]|uniref:Innexin n=1 Tax=Zophobas morio TaxID=2755281 RepID=A0AA38M1X1_9CUCU|nr:hypothetical protein Zmor_027231 [Zophobas morio]
MHHAFYALSNGPLAIVLSQMGRLRTERFHKGRFYYRTQAPLRTRVSRKIDDREPARKRRVHDDGFTSMDLLRGVYMLTQVNHVTIDSLIFRLHTNATVILLVTFSIAVTTRQYVGNPIDCVHTRDIPEEVLNTYCWIHSTYTVIDAFKKPPGNHQASYPGVHNSGKSPVKQVKYYQWVAFTLFFQLSWLQLRTIK